MLYVAVSWFLVVVAPCSRKCQEFRVSCSAYASSKAAGSLVDSNVHLPRRGQLCSSLSAAAIRIIFWNLTPAAAACGGSYIVCAKISACRCNETFTIVKCE